MAITGISAISGEQIIAAGAVSAKEAGKASFTTGGNDIQNLYDTVSTNSASWTSTPITFPLNVTGKNVYVAKNSDTSMPASAVAGNKGLSSYFIVDAGRPRQIDYTGTVNYNGLDLETVNHYTNKTAGARYGVTGIRLLDDNSTGNIDIASIQNWNSTYDTVSANSASWENVVTSTATGVSYNTGISAINGTPLLATGVFNNGKMLVGSSDPGMYLTGTHGTAYYKANELIINRTGYGEQIKFNLGSAGSQVIGSAASTRGAFIDMSNESHEAFLGVRNDEDAKLELDGEVITPTKITGYDSVYSTVNDYSAGWGGASYTAGNMISLAGDIVSVSSQAGITDIVSATALPQDPVSTVLYLIPEA